MVQMQRGGFVKALGIGLALAQQAAAAGAKVSLIARSREKLDAARTAIRAAVPAAVRCTCCKATE